MKINRRAVSVLICLLLFSLLVSACSSNKFAQNESTQDIAPHEPESGYDDMDMSYEEKGIGSGMADINVEPAKVITNVHLSLETTKFDSSIENLNKLIATSKGFIEDSNISLRNHSHNKVFKHADYTIRVPKDRADGFISQMGSIGNAISQNTSRQDITKQYYDTESRLKLLEIKEERMTALLEKANKMEDIIAIENQLSEIIHQKEGLNRDVLSMDDQVAYSTVYLSISEVEKLRSDITTSTTFATKFSNTINDSLYMFATAMETFLLVLIYLLPYLIIGGIIGFLVLKFVKKERNKEKRKE